MSSVTFCVSRLRISSLSLSLPSAFRIHVIHVRQQQQFKKLKWMARDSVAARSFHRSASCCCSYFRWPNFIFRRRVRKNIPRLLLLLQSLGRKYTRRKPPFFGRGWSTSSRFYFILISSPFFYSSSVCVFAVAQAEENEKKRRKPRDRMHNDCHRRPTESFKHAAAKQQEDIHAWPSSTDTLIDGGSTL